MSFDQAQSPRLGQRTQVESTSVRMFAGTEIPEAAWPGQIIYRTDTQGLQVFTEAGAWEDVVGGVPGILTFVGPSIPVSVSIGDMWFDTDDHYKLYVARSAGADAITAGEWELTQDSYTASQAAAAAQSTANAAASAVASLSTLTTPDGSAPSSSPTPTVTGGVNSLGIKWPAITNHDPVSYEVHVSTSSATFTPGAGTLQATTSATSYSVIDHLADGSGLVTDGVVTYYVRIIAKDSNGSGGFNSAAPGTAGSATLRQVTTGDIATNYVYAGTINAARIDSGSMSASVTVSGTIRTADTGQRVEIDSTGWKQYGSDGTSVITSFPNDVTQIAFIKNAVMQAKTLTVTDGIEIRGGAGGQNVFAPGSSTILSEGITAPASSPSLTSGYELGPVWSDYLAPPAGAWFNDAESTQWYSAQFFGVGMVRTGSTYYSWPQVANSTGTVNRSSFIPDHGMAPIMVGANPRLVLIGVRYSPGWVEGTYNAGTYEVWKMIDPATVSNTTTPTELWETSYYSPPNLSMVSAVGRCFSSSGAARASWFATIRTDNSIPSAPVIRLQAHSATDTAMTQQVSRTINGAFPWAAGEGLVGITFGSSARMGFVGTDQDVWVISTTANNYVYLDATTPTRQTYRDFPAPPGGNTTFAGGDLATNNFTRFYNKTWSNGTIYKYSNIDWDNSVSPTWYGTYTWYDSVGPPYHEATMAPYSVLNMAKRSSLFVTTPDLPDPAGGKGTARGVDDVNSFRLYLSRGTPTPSRTAFWSQTLQPADLATSFVVSTQPQFSGTTNPPSAGNFPASSPAVFQSNAIGTGSLPKIQLTGSGSAHFEALDIAGLGAASLTGRAFDQLYYSIRAQSQLTGGGTKTVDSSFNISWSSRFLCISLGTGSNLATSGFFDIAMPANTTVIPGYGGASNQTVTSGKFLLNSWCALYYEMPYGSTNTSLSANFRIVYYGSTFTVPNNWVLLAVNNLDAARIEWATGENVPANSDSSYYNIGGQLIKKFNIGGASDTTDASGRCSYAHGLTMTPAQVVVSKANSGSTLFIGAVDTFTSSTFSVLYRLLSTGAVAGSGLGANCYFVAIA